jgi:hypothetical protein
VKTAPALVDSVLMTCPHRDEAADACRVLARIAARKRDHAYAAVAAQAAKIIEALPLSDGRLEQASARRRVQ